MSQLLIGFSPMSFKAFLPSVIYFLVLLSLCSCVSVGSDYKPPDLTFSPVWRSAMPEGIRVESGHTEDISRRWQQLNDPMLTDLIERAMNDSVDLHVAQARLREADARRALAESQFFPSVNASASTQRSRSRIGYSMNSVTSTLHRIGPNVSWEIDIFGRLRRGAEAARANQELSAASLHDTQNNIASEIALNYIELRTSQARLRVAHVNSDSQRSIYQIASWRAEAGITSAVDVEQALASYEQTNAQIFVLENSIAETEHRIAILLGVEPGSLVELQQTDTAVPEVPDELVIGIPIDVLRQRPDVRAAEKKLAAETARVGEAEAGHYPQLNLAGSIGRETLGSHAFSDSSIRVASISAVIAVPLFDGGRVDAQVEIQTAIRDQAFSSYQKAILVALQDVENALAALSSLKERTKHLRKAFSAAQKATFLATHRYTAGITDFQYVFEAQRTLLTIEDSLKLSEGNEAAALVNLFRALGGGWSPVEESE